MGNNRRYLTTRQLAEEWGVRVDVVFYHAYLDHIPGARQNRHGRWLFPADAAFPDTSQGGPSRAYCLTDAGRAVVAAYRAARGRETIDVPLRCVGGRWELAV